MKYKKVSILAILVVIMMVGVAMIAFASGIGATDSNVPDGYIALSLSTDEICIQKDGPRDTDSAVGVLTAVNRNDENKFTAEEWADILERVKTGEILFFETLEEEVAYFHGSKP